MRSTADRQEAPAPAAPEQQGLAPLAASVLALQRSAGNAAVASMLARRGAREGPPGVGATLQRAVGARAPRETRGEGTEAVIFRMIGCELRRGRNDHGGLGHLHHGHPIFVVKRDAGRGWSEVTTARGKHGFVPTDVVKTDLPCPGARIHVVDKHQTALRIAFDYFGDHIPKRKKSLGERIKHFGDVDGRFYVNVLSYINPRQQASDNWEDVKFDSMDSIWIPTNEFALTLKGKVKTGSTIRDAWQGVKNTVGKAVGFVVGGAAFVAGLVTSVRNTIEDLVTAGAQAVKTVYKAIKSTLAGTILSDVKGLWEQISKLNVRQLLRDQWTTFKRGWNADDPWKRWFFRGETIGEILIMAILAFLTGGTTLIASAAAKFGKLVSVIRRLPAVERIMRDINVGRRTSIAKRLPAKYKARIPIRPGPRLSAALKAHRLRSHPIFQLLIPQTQGKVLTALSAYTRKLTGKARRTAIRWAIRGSRGSAREFANRFEYALAKVGEARTNSAGKKGVDLAEVSAAAVRPARLRSAIRRDRRNSRRLGRGARINLPHNASPDAITEALQKLNRFAFESPTAEAYHAVKHGRELPPQHASGRKDAVAQYAASARQTIKNGSAKADKKPDGSVKVTITRTYGEAPATVTMTAVVFVKPSTVRRGWRVVLATYGGQ